VQTIDANGGTVELEHGPIPSLNWPAMTMEFKVRDKAQLGALSRGQAVEFEVSDDSVIERIAPASGHAGHGG
jgi:Cu/Ag efflux protein CusF